MTTTIHCPADCGCGCHTEQLQSHLGAVNIMHGVTGGVIQYLLEIEDGEGEALAMALLNANRLLRNTLPELALEEQAWPRAFTTVSDEPLPAPSDAALDEAAPAAPGGVSRKARRTP